MSTTTLTKPRRRLAIEAPSPERVPKLVEMTYCHIWQSVIEGRQFVQFDPISGAFSLVILPEELYPWTKNPIWASDVIRACRNYDRDCERWYKRELERAKLPRLKPLDKQKFPLVFDAPKKIAHKQSLVEPGEAPQRRQWPQRTYGKHAVEGESYKIYRRGRKTYWPKAWTFEYVRLECSHCHDGYNPYICQKCKQQPKECCPDCHREVIHKDSLSYIAGEITEDREALGDTNVALVEGKNFTVCPKCKETIPAPADKKIQTWVRQEIYQGYGLLPASEQLSISSRHVQWLSGDIFCPMCFADITPQKINILCYHWHITVGETYEEIAKRCGLSEKQIGDKLRWFKRLYPTIPRGRGPVPYMVKRGRNLQEDKGGAQLLLKHGEYTTEKSFGTDDTGYDKVYEKLPKDLQGRDRSPRELVYGLIDCWEQAPKKPATESTEPISAKEWTVFRYHEQENEKGRKLTVKQTAKMMEIQAAEVELLLKKLKAKQPELFLFEGRFGTKLSARKKS